MILKSNKFKILEIIIDDKLYWKSTINYISTKLSRAIVILDKVKLKLNMKSVVLVYN